ncbi:MAG: hypothetical protein ACR2MW_08990 [Chthoniobacterales bacterium]
MPHINQAQRDISILVTQGKQPAMDGRGSGGPGSHLTNGHPERSAA